jgi:hypothetical protein
MRMDKQTNGQMVGQIFTHYSGISSHSLMGVQINMLNWSECCCVNWACVFREMINLVVCRKFHGCGCVADFSPRGRSKSYGIKHKPTTVKYPQKNAILECVHQVLGQMLCAAENDMADSVTPDDVDVFLDNMAWAIRSTYHTVLKASPGAAIFWTRHAL